MSRIISINLISFSDTKSVGTFVFIKRVLTELFNMDLKDCSFIIYIQNGLSKYDFAIPDSDNIRIVRVPRFKKSILRILFEQTLFYFYLKRCDVFFTPSLSLPLFARGKKISTIHDMIPFWDSQKYSWIIRYYVIFMTYLTAKVADCIVTVSQSSKKDIIRLLKVDESKIHIIYNFLLNDELVTRNRNDISLKLKNDEILDLNVPFFLTVSTLQPAKNIDGLIKSFALFVRRFPSYYLYIVGNKGWNYTSLFNLVKEKNIADRVIFTGYLDDVSLSLLYSKCKGVIYVSFYEGFGIPPLEGFYHGKICVASNTSSIPEVVGMAGYLVNPYDVNSIEEGMENLVKDQENRKQYIPIQLQKFDSKKEVRKLLDLFFI